MGKLPQILAKIWLCPRLASCRNQTAEHMIMGKYSVTRDNRDTFWWKICKSPFSHFWETMAGTLGYQSHNSRLLHMTWFWLFHWIGNILMVNQKHSSVFFWVRSNAKCVFVVWKSICWWWHYCNKWVRRRNSRLADTTGKSEACF